ncbi:MAG: citrate synthase [Actinomycetaceae bacterium]|nr:citrate synthase [Arcanobacterium sp.]MDD7687156.1 citrate synthase [Actinomycetaceae bacterium]MDY5273899.1 citrate synthase [Arcanobacterium sp.]
MAKNATITIDGTAYELPRVEAVNGYDGFDIGKLLANSGAITLDNGFANTGSCTSSITFIDGENGVLRYRGYPIEDLAENCTFLEVAFLLIYGELPDANSLSQFIQRIKKHTLLHEDFKHFFTSFPSNGHPMSMLQSAVAGLGTYYPDALNPLDPHQLDLASVLLLAKVPTMVAYASKRATGLPLLYPDSSKSYTEDFLRMTFGLPYQTNDVDPTIVNALDKIFILHADHEQNCSTSTARLVGSSHASLFASISSAIGALSGPLHGGANEAVLDMLGKIREQGISIPEFVSQVKDKKNGVKLMGFGHRVYKNYDPRAKVVKALADDILDKLHADSEIFDMARELEYVALNDDYFVERKLYPNVDFYTGVLYKAMGFPTQMFTPLFVVGRLPGWIAQFREMINDPSTKIGRPRQVYIGEDERKVPPMKDRVAQGFTYEPAFEERV